jgi:hypothetical protein
MPIILEAPLWLILPSVSVPAIAADWITSALPFDIADQIADRPTDSVYFELSALEHYGPRPDAIPESGVIYARAIWLIRAAGRFICTIYAVDSGKLFSYIVEYTFSHHTGTFERARWTNEPAQLDETLQSVFNTALKCLYLALTVLRDLSPGFKPPAVIAKFSTVYSALCLSRKLALSQLSRTRPIGCLKLVMALPIYAPAVRSRMLLNCGAQTPTVT